MVGNIACFKAGCKKPVIGQCPGYKESCGHFYCAQHSSGKFCAECANDEEAQRLDEDNQQTAQEVDKWAEKGTRWMPLFYLLGWGLVWMIADGVLPKGSELRNATGVFLLLGGLGVGFCCLPIGMWIRKNWLAEARAIEIDANKPGFAEYYRDWRKAKRKGVWATALGLMAAIVVGGLAAEAEKTSDKKRIERAVGDELNRRGYR
jgi:hypothetical protein